MSEQTPQREPGSRFGHIAIAFLATGLAVTFGANIYQYSRLVNLQMEVKGLSRELGSVREIVASTDKSILSTIDSLRDEVDANRKTTATEVGQAKAAARRQAEVVAARLSKQQEEQRKELAQNIDQLKSSSEVHASTLSTRLTDISSDIGSVKTEVASAKSDFEKTTAELHRMTGDLGVMSGLIATNSRELAALRELGERNYQEFRIPRAKGAQKVGDIVVLLKKTDPRRNRYTLEITADDKRVEKKDRTINEPIQFYVLSKARSPYELVVNEVTKDEITGYLSTPKVRMARY